MEKHQTVTQSEWQIMELLWLRPHTLMELVAELSQSIGWSKSTTATMIHRMQDKDLIGYEMDGRTKQFYAAVSREDVVARETDTLLSRAYQGSIGLMLSAMVHHKNLSKDDIDELYAILSEAENALQEPAHAKGETVL